MSIPLQPTSGPKGIRFLYLCKLGVIDSSSGYPYLPESILCPSVFISIGIRYRNDVKVLLNLSVNRLIRFDKALTNLFSK